MPLFPTRDAAKGSPSYRDADLDRLARKPFGISIERPDRSATTTDDTDPYADEPSLDELLAAAHGTLDRANKFAAENSTSNLANLPTRLASLSQGERPTASKAFGAFTKPIGDVGQGAELAALPLGFVNPVAGGALFAAGRTAAAPDILRRALLPERAADQQHPMDPEFQQAFNISRGTPDMSNDESRLGAVGEGALSYSPELLKGAKALKGVANIGSYADVSKIAAEEAATAASEAAARNATLGPKKIGLGRVVSSEMNAPQVDPNQVLKVAQEISAETGVPVEKLVKQFGGGAQQQDALLGLVRGGQAGRASRGARATEQAVAGTLGARDAGMAAEMQGARRKAVLSARQIIDTARGVAKETGVSHEQAIADYLKQVPPAQQQAYKDALEEELFRQRPYDEIEGKFSQLLDRFKGLKEETRKDIGQRFPLTPDPEMGSGTIIGADTPMPGRGSNMREVLRRQRQLTLGHVQVN